MDDSALLARLDRMAASTEALHAEIRALRAGPAPLRLAWLYKRYAKVHRRARSWRLFRNLLAPLVRRCGRVVAAEINATAWSEHVAVRLETPTRLGKPPTAATLNLELRRAQHMFRWAARQKLIAANPLDGVKPLEAVSARETWLTEEQVTALVAACAQLRFEHQRLLLRAFVLIAVSTGMRFNEIRKLRRDRIGPGGLVELSARVTKSRRRRIVALDEAAVEAVADVPVIVGDQRIFASARTGQLWDETSIRLWFRAAVELAGLDAAVAEGDVLLLPHDLRHTAASLADERGAHALAIRDMLGHSHLATTERYLHRQQQEAAKQIAALMSRRGPQRVEPGTWLCHTPGCSAANLDRLERCGACGKDRAESTVRPLNRLPSRTSTPQK